MATVRLRVRLGRILEELPSVCLYYGEPVEEFTVVHMMLHFHDVQFLIPLCLNELREEVFVELKQGFGALPGTMEAIVGGLADILLAPLHAASGHPAKIASACSMMRATNTSK